MLGRVTAPTMLIVGGNDSEVIAMNRDVLDCLRCPKALRIVPSATHFFEEPGALEEVAAIASEWFRRWFAVGQGKMPAANFARTDQRPPARDRASCDSTAASPTARSSATTSSSLTWGKWR